MFQTFIVLRHATFALLHSEVYCEEASKEHEHETAKLKPSCAKCCQNEIGGPQPCSFTWSHKGSQCKAIAKPLRGHAVNATDPSDVSLFPSLPMDWVISNNPKAMCKFDACSRPSSCYAMQLLHFCILRSTVKRQVKNMNTRPLN